MKKANFNTLKDMVEGNMKKKLYTLCGSLCSGPHKNPEEQKKYHDRMVKVIGR